MLAEIQLKEIVEQISNHFKNEELFHIKTGYQMPDQNAITHILLKIRQILFPGYFSHELSCDAQTEYFIGNHMINLYNELAIQIKAALAQYKKEEISEERIAEKTDEICSSFFTSLPHIQTLLIKDIHAAFDGDPAALSKEEIIFCYPGFFAIFIYRIAHELYHLKTPSIPRIMSEYAHSQTGIDINPGAEIGEYFFIDHGTGVVIGETAKIGNHVKIYQGVTLGALSTRSGQLLRDVKRHPTIEDDVTIYSSASILGGETIIGKGVVVGGNCFITESVPAGSHVTVKHHDISITET